MAEAKADDLPLGTGHQARCFRSTRIRTWPACKRGTAPRLSPEFFTATVTGTVASPVIGKRLGGCGDGWRGTLCWLGSSRAGTRTVRSPGFQEAVGYYGKLQEDGQIERFEAYLLDPHGGDLAGFFLIHAERSVLDTIRSSAEFQRLLVRARRETRVRLVGKKQLRRTAATEMVTCTQSPRQSSAWWRGQRGSDRPPGDRGRLPLGESTGAEPWTAST
jgi:hypothetical protein